MPEGFQNTIVAIQQAASLGEAMDIVVKKVCQALEVDACTVFVLERDDNELIMMASTIENYTLILGHWSIEIGNDLVGKVAQNGEPLSVENVLEHEDHVEIA